MVGATEIALAIKMRREIKGEWFLILMGLASIIFAGLLFWNPLAGAAALIWIIAWYAVIMGVLAIVFGFRLLISQEFVKYPNVEWEVRTPEEVGLDVAKLQEFSASVGGAGAIVRDGYMVYTWGNQSARTGQAWASASKSVVSTMLFFAIIEGRLSGARRHRADLRAAAVSGQGSDREGRPDDVPPSGQRSERLRAARGARQCLGVQRSRIQTVQIPGVGTALWGQSDQREPGGRGDHGARAPGPAPVPGRIAHPDRQGRASVERHAP